MRALGMRKNNRIVRGDQTRCDENSCRVGLECRRAIFFAVANLLIEVGVCFVINDKLRTLFWFVLISNQFIL